MVGLQANGKTLGNMNGLLVFEHTDLWLVTLDAKQARPRREVRHTQQAPLKYSGVFVVGLKDKGNTGESLSCGKRQIPPACLLFLHSSVHHAPRPGFAFS